LAIISSRDVIDLGMVPPSITEQRSGSAEAGDSAADEIDYRKAREMFERDFFRRRLEENEWNISRTSEAVGLERSNLHRKMKQLGIRKES
jgi:two-component system nitrogen regulation response regulator NtrX